MILFIAAFLQLKHIKVSAESSEINANLLLFDIKLTISKIRQYKTIYKRQKTTNVSSMTERDNCRNRDFAFGKLKNFVPSKNR